MKFFFKTNFVKYLCAYKWKCVNKKCNAKIYINESLTEILKYDIDHKNHEKQPINVFKKKLYLNELLYYFINILYCINYYTDY